MKDRKEQYELKELFRKKKQRITWIGYLWRMQENYSVERFWWQKKYGQI